MNPAPLNVPNPNPDPGIATLLVDDEPAASRRLGALLAPYPEIKVIGTATTLGEARRYLRTHQPELIFLDIEMSAGSGLDLLPLLDQRTAVVFVTAHATHAVAAFTAGALDYLVKPVDADRIAVTIQRLLRQVRQRPAATGPAIGGSAALPAIGDKIPLTLHKPRTTELVPVRSIVWIEAMQNYSRLQLQGRAPMVLKRTMAQWEALLPGDNFQRLDRSLIIQLALLRATEWQTRNRTQLVFEGVPERLGIGRVAMSRLRELLDAHAPGTA